MPSKTGEQCSLLSGAICDLHLHIMGLIKIINNGGNFFSAILVHLSHLLESHHLAAARIITRQSPLQSLNLLNSWPLRGNVEKEGLKWINSDAMNL